MRVESRARDDLEKSRQKRRDLIQEKDAVQSPPTDPRKKESPPFIGPRLNMDNLTPREPHPVRKRKLGTTNATDSNLLFTTTPTPKPRETRGLVSWLTRFMGRLLASYDCFAQLLCDTIHSTHIRRLGGRSRAESWRTCQDSTWCANRRIWHHSLRYNICSRKGQQGGDRHREISRSYARNLLRQ